MTYVETKQDELRKHLSSHDQMYKRSIYSELHNSYACPARHATLALRQFADTVKSQSITLATALSIDCYCIGAFMGWHMELSHTLLPVLLALTGLCSHFSDWGKSRHLLAVYQHISSTNPMAWQTCQPDYSVSIFHPDIAVFILL